LFQTRQQREVPAEKMPDRARPTKKNDGRHSCFQLGNSYFKKKDVVNAAGFS
jgi:hypothetical protein